MNSPGGRPGKNDANRRAAPLIVSPLLLFLIFCAHTCSGRGFVDSGAGGGELKDLARLRDYRSMRASSYDTTGANDDGNWSRPLQPGERRVIADLKGPGIIRHVWFTLSSREPGFLKRVVLRITWDDAGGPSVRVPIGDFFGLALGEYVQFEAGPISVGNKRALNAFFPMPFHKRAKIELENQGRVKLQAFYYNIDYEAHDGLAGEQAYFHAAYHQALPTDGTVAGEKSNRDPRVLKLQNRDGAGNYTILETTGRGHYVGVFHGIRQRENDWWGEGDEMIFIDGEQRPRIHGTGAEDYYLGAWCYGSCVGKHDGKPFAYARYGNPVNGGHKPGSKWLVYRFHLESPINFRRSLRVSIEHGHGNHRSDDYYSVAYWYQLPARGLPALPAVESRILPDLSR